MKPRLKLEALEDRITPANSITIESGVDGLTSIPAGATLFSDTGNYVIDPSAFTGLSNFSLASNGQILMLSSLPPLPGGGTLNFLAGGSLYLEGNIQTSNANVLFYANDPNATQAQRPGGDAELLVTVQASITDTGTGNMSFIGGNGDSAGANTHPNCPVDFDTGTVVTGGTGANGITIAGTSNSQTSGDAVLINGATINGNGGNISVIGSLGNTSGDGIHLENSAKVQNTQSGSVSFNGTGVLQGVNIGTNSSVTTVDGLLSISGNDPSGNTDFSSGTVIDGATVQAIGNGGVTLTGTGSPNFTLDPGVLILSAAVNVDNGSLSIGGTGMGSATTNVGNDIEGSTVKATGSSGITIRGAAPANTAVIDLSGTLFAGGSGSITTNTGFLDLLGNVINLGVANSVSSTGGSTLFFTQSDGDFPMILGGNNVTGSLVFTDTDLAAIASGFGLVKIGSGVSTSGITTASNLTPFTSNLTIRNSLTGTGPITISNTIDDRCHTLTILAGGAHHPGHRATCSRPPTSPYTITRASPPAQHLSRHTGQPPGGADQSSPAASSSTTPGP